MEETIKRMEINVTANRQTIEKNQQSFSKVEKFNWIYNPLARLIKKQKRQITNINVEGDHTTDATNIKTIINECYEQLQCQQIWQTKEKNKFLEKYNFPKWTEEKSKSQVAFYLLRKVYL